ncbi:MAG: hypothetical protein CMJ55_07150 [Planctomycetaceae bacterium]|nr:hypothetical protein [Planctomycetaceae bacterium]
MFRSPLRMTSPFSTKSIWILLLVFCSLNSLLLAQDEEKPKKELPPVESHVLETKDGIFLNVKFYPGTKGKDSIPIIMLHSMLNVSSNSAVYTKLATAIQEHMGHAVIIPDLRGHGKSVQRRNPRDINGRIEIDREKFSKTEFASVVQDIEACKSFLRTKNDEGQLNLEKLTVVGSDITAIIAMNWAALDWNKPGKGLIRNGQDVKALVLFTPLQSHKGLTPQLGLSHPTVKQNLNIMIIAGAQNPQYFSESKRIHNQLTRFHKDQTNADGTINWSGTKLFLFGLNTGAQGSGILQVAKPEPHPNALFYNFLINRLEKDETLQWSSRDPNAL